MITKLMELLFGCSHANYGFPITRKSGRFRRGSAVKRTYVVCLDCAQELQYDWEEMRVIKSSIFRRAKQESKEHVFSCSEVLDV